jgi:DNA repair photolyase
MSKTLKILSRPQGNAEEYGRWSVNPYKGCSHGCLYCYLKKGVWANWLGGSTAQLKSGVVNEEHAYHLAMAEIIEHRDEIIRDGGLFMTFTSDPCVEETRDLFLKIVKDAMDKRVPVVLLTKNADFTKEYYYENIRWRLSVDSYGHDVAFGWTLTGHNELEPNAHSNEMRLQEMTRVYRDGFKVWASIEPVIDFPSSLDMIYQALDAGCQHFKIGLLTNNTRLVRKDFAFGEHQFEAYDLAKCVEFVESVMAVTKDRATVYWKQSFVDFFGDEPIHGMTASEFLHQWPHSVDKDWNMFKKED